MENMRKWIAQFLFDFDQTIPPLDTLEKFLRGELPELDANKKKEASKRKSGALAHLLRLDLVCLCELLLGPVHRVGRLGRDIVVPVH